MNGIMYIYEKGGKTPMQNINVTNFRRNLFGLLEQTIKYNEPINIATKNGNAIIISEDDYNDIMETVLVNSNPSLKTKITEGMNTPLSACVSEDEVPW